MAWNGLMVDKCSFVSQDQRMSGSGSRFGSMDSPISPVIEDTFYLVNWQLHRLIFMNWLSFVLFRQGMSHHLICRGTSHLRTQWQVVGPRPLDLMTMMTGALQTHNLGGHCTTSQLAAMMRYRLYDPTEKLKGFIVWISICWHDCCWFAAELGSWRGSWDWLWGWWVVLCKLTFPCIFIFIKSFAIIFFII